MWRNGGAGGLTITGNTISGQTNPTYSAVYVPGGSDTVSGNVLVGNAVGINATRGAVSNNRVEGSSSVGIDAYDNAVTGNVVIGGPVGIRMRSNGTGTPQSLLNNLVYGVTTTGIELNALGDGTTVYNNTVSAGGGTAISVVGTGSSIALRNNILVVTTGTAISVASTSQTGFTSNYNLFNVTAGGAVGNWQNAVRLTLSLWRSASATDANSLAGDPFFVNAATGDYHEQSSSGSFKGGSLAPVLGGNGLPTAATITLSPDAQHSPAIDRGDPSMPFANEPAPNSGLVNIGAFGNTAQASLSPTGFVTVTSPDGGEQWPIGQSFSIKWISHNTSGTVNIVLTEAGADVLTIASGIANSGTFNWTVPVTLTPGSDYRVRITRTDAAGSDTSDADFTIAAPTTVYYVNDAATAGDVFTTTAGTALGDGLSPATPNLSIKYILDNYDLGPNDVIRVDSGTYATTVDITIASDDSGVTIEGPDWSALGAPLATINRGAPRRTASCLAAQTPTTLRCGTSP
ncbi:MAG: Ser-Thr-rich GPI-anchored membrane family protein [Tepidisphaeraceae bacterium]